MQRWCSVCNSKCCPPPPQVDVIKKAYLQEEERENSEVSPREVGHNIYILALQVPSLPEALPLCGHAP